MVNLRQHFTFNEYCYLREELERSLARRRQAEPCSQLALSQHRAHDERQRSIDLTSTTRSDVPARVQARTGEYRGRIKISRRQRRAFSHQRDLRARPRLWVRAGVAYTENPLEERRDQGTCGGSGPSPERIHAIEATASV